MIVSLFQYNILFEDKARNKARILEILENSRIVKNSWFIFPEMSLTGFSLNPEIATLSEKDLLFFEEIAKKYRIFITFGGIIDKKNKSITIDPEGQILNEYNKIHLFRYGGENKIYTKGDKINTFWLDMAKITPFICYDLRFADMFWNKALDTDIFVVIADWPEKRRDHWLSILKTRAIENQAYVIGVNCLGSDPNNTYSGDSVIFGPFGDKIIYAHSAEGIFSAELNLETLEYIREKFKFLKDR